MQGLWVQHRRARGSEKWKADCGGSGRSVPLPGRFAAADRRHASQASPAASLWMAALERALLGYRHALVAKLARRRQTAKLQSANSCSQNVTRSARCTCSATPSTCTARWWIRSFEHALYVYSMIDDAHSTCTPSVDNTGIRVQYQVAKAMLQHECTYVYTECIQ